MLHDDPVQLSHCPADILQRHYGRANQPSRITRGILGDERKTKQILLNLLSNAVKFTPEGGRIGIKARQADGSGERHGYRHRPEDHARIFEEFR